MRRVLKSFHPLFRFTGADSGAPANSPFVVELVAEAALYVLITIYLRHDMVKHTIS